MQNLENLWLISGRVCGDDDDTQHIVEAADQGAANALFIKRLIDDADGDEETEVFVILSTPLMQAINEKVKGDASLPAGKIEVRRYRRVTASVDIQSTYIVDAAEYNKLVEEDEAASALQSLIDEGKANRTSYETEVDEVFQEHEVDVEEI